MYALFIIRVRVPAIIEIWERLSFYYHLNIYLCTLIAANSNDNKVLSFSNLNYKFKVTRITKNFWCTCAPPRGSKDVLQSVILPVSPFPIVHNNGRWCSVVIALLCSPSVCFPWPSFNNTITNHKSQLQGIFQTILSLSTCNVYTWVSLRSMRQKHTVACPCTITVVSELTERGTTHHTNTHLAWKSRYGIYFPQIQTCRYDFLPQGVQTSSPPFLFKKNVTKAKTLNNGQIHCLFLINGFRFSIYDIMSSVKFEFESSLINYCSLRGLARFGGGLQRRFFIMIMKKIIS